MNVPRLAPLKEYGLDWHQYLIKAMAYAAFNSWDQQTFTNQILIGTQQHAALFATFRQRLLLSELMEFLDELLSAKT